MLRTPAGIWTCLTGGIFVFDGLTRDVNHWLSRGAKRILLRHGVGIKVLERGIKTPKPVIFFVPDLDDYLSYSRSFYFNYADVTPGAKVKTTEALEQALRQAVMHGNGEWREQYEAVLDQFHVFRDACARERTYHEIRRRFLGVEVPPAVA